MKTITTLFLFIACFNVISAQDYNKELLDEQARDYLISILQKDYDKTISLMHTSIVEKGGGEKYIKQDFLKEEEAHTKQGFKLVDGDIGDVVKTYTSTDGAIHVVLPQEMIVDFSGSKFKSTSYLLAASSDEGNTWSFVSLEKHSKESIKLFIPTVSEDLEWPPNQAYQAIDEN